MHTVVHSLSVYDALPQALAPDDPRWPYYLGHVDILGTETYLTATPELMALAGDRFRHRYDRERRT